MGVEGLMSGDTQILTLAHNSSLRSIYTWAPVIIFTVAEGGGDFKRRRDQLSPIEYEIGGTANEQ